MGPPAPAYTGGADWAASLAARRQLPAWATQAPGDPNQVFRDSERVYRQQNDPSVSGAAYRAVLGDTISTILGSSRPQDIGNFMRANGLTSDKIEAGRNYFVPDSSYAYGDNANLGQSALNMGNTRLADIRRAEEAAANLPAFDPRSHGRRGDGPPVWHQGAVYGQTSAASQPAVSDDALYAALGAAGLDPSVMNAGKPGGPATWVDTANTPLGGAVAGTAASFGKMAYGAANLAANTVNQALDIATGGYFHDTPLMQRSWAQNAVVGQGLVNAFTSPVETTTNLIEAGVNHYNAALAETDPFTRAFKVGEFVTDGLQAAVGFGAGVRGLAAVGDVAVRSAASNALRLAGEGDIAAQTANLMSDARQAGAAVRYGDTAMVDVNVAGAVKSVNGTWGVTTERTLPAIGMDSVSVARGQAMAAEADAASLTRHYTALEPGHVSPAQMVSEVRTFEAQGLSPSAARAYLQTAEGRNMASAIWAADPTASAARVELRAAEWLATGVELPTQQIMTSPLVKIVPEGQGVTPYSPFFTTPEALSQASASGRTLADALGLPVSREAPRYSVFQISPLQPAGVFRSTVAPTTELGGLLQRTGGAQQYIVPNRGLWSAPKLLGTVANTSSLTIASSRATGNPAAISRGLGGLNSHQSGVLDQLPGFGASTIAHKSFGQADLAALTAATGEEFAMFSTGGRRLVFRGNAESVPITTETAADLGGQGWRWSAHTHPGFDPGVLRSSIGDRAVLEAMGGRQSSIFNSLGQRRLFTPNGDSLNGWTPW